MSFNFLASIIYYILLFVLLGVFFASAYHIKQESITHMAQRFGP